jgi:hypothetical protein
LDPLSSSAPSIAPSVNDAETMARWVRQKLSG